ncbi:hypothetical protein Q7P37_002368 [Cladosporium fusiforme]
MSTIDPGVEDRIKQCAEDVEENGQEKEQDEPLDTEDTRQPSRWWFASTACPLLAGTFGPIASGFNICALVYHWRQYIPPGGTESTSEQAGQTLPDPPFLIGLNVASLVCALVGNASLLLNMARRVRFAIAQPITITGFLLAGLLLIADLAALSGSPNHAITLPEAIPHNRHAFTGAFYYGIFAAAIYVIIAGLMFLTVHGANKGHYKKEFELTAPQRTLMLQTMSFITYLLLGALVYSQIEGWEYLNAVYWADVTLLTVGLGEFSPSTSLGKGLLFPFAIGGILMVGLVVGSIRSLVLERGKEKLGARIVEKKRSKATHHRTSVPTLLSPKPSAEKEEFVAMRKVQNASERERRWFGLATSGALALTLWLVGAAVFQQTEHTQQWTYLEAVYFSYTSLLTIGYGDFHPQSNSGKAFFVIWSLLAVPSLTILISNMGDTIVKWFSDITVSVAAITVLPGDEGFRAGFKAVVRDFSASIRASMSSFTMPGLLGDIPQKHHTKQQPSTDPTAYSNRVTDRMAANLAAHAPPANELSNSNLPSSEDSSLENDIRFYHYVLARECRNVQKDLNANPPKQYAWEDWEYFLTLVGDDGCEENDSERGSRGRGTLVPEPLKGAGELSNVSSSSENSEGHIKSEKPTNSYPSPPKQPLPSRPKHHHHHHPGPQHRQQQQPTTWSWLSNQSPLMSSKSEAEWILDRLSAALERELDSLRRGERRVPPVGLGDLKRTEEGDFER